MRHHFSTCPLFLYAILLPLSLSACFPTDPAQGPCDAWNSESIQQPSIVHTGSGISLEGESPEFAGADSVDWMITDGTTMQSGTSTGLMDPATMVTTQNPGPWTATFDYKKAGCPDRMVSATTTVNFTPPGPVTNLQVTTETYGATLSWQNPTDPNFVAVVVVAKVGSPATSAADPAAVNLCNGGTCMGTSLHSLGVPAGNVAFTVYASNSLVDGNLSPPTTMMATVPGIPAWKAVFAGGAQSYGIASDGTLWGWGYTSPAPVPVTGVAPVRVNTDTDWKKVACSMLFVYGLKNDGHLYTWTGTPVLFSAFTDWVDVTAGNSHFLGIRSNGTLWSWGSNSNGQLGDGTTTDHQMPMQVGTDTNWAKIGAGYTHSFAIKTDGSLWAFGSNVNGELGDGTNVDRHAPLRIGSANDWSQIVGGYSASIAIRGAGTLWGWGYPGLNGTDSNFDVTTPTQIGSASDWTKVAMVYFNVLGLRQSGGLWDWGGGDMEAMSSKSTPTEIDTSQWLDIAAGDVSSIALKSGGSRWGWGRNDHGEVGDGNTIQQTAPIATP